MRSRPFFLSFGVALLSAWISFGSALAQSTVTVTETGNANIYGAFSGFAVDYDATTGLTGNWNPDLQAGQLYRINSVTLTAYKGTGAKNTSNFYLGVYSGYDNASRSLTGFLGVSDQTRNFSTVNDGTDLIWTFNNTNLTVTPGLNPGSGSDIRYYILQTVTTAISAPVAYGETTGIRRIDGNVGTFNDELAAIIDARSGIGLQTNRAPEYKASVSLITTPIAINDAIQTGIGGAIAFDPSANDSGNINPNSIVILTSPSRGSAQFDAARRRIVYRHAGTASGSDSFTYRISNSSGSQTATGTVNVTISPAMRQAAQTVQVPETAPGAAVGSLTIKDALPGVTFTESVAVCPIPGSPKSLFVAGVRGDVWYIPDTTVASPQKIAVLNIDSLTNETQGRSIYSIECFPNFAQTGYVIINYQGDKLRLPQQGTGSNIQNVIPGLDKDGNPYNTITCDLRVSRFTLSPAHLAAAADGLSAAENRAALLTEFPYLNLAEQDLFHSIDDAKFDAEGYLYVTFGDEGSQGSPFRNSQLINKDQYSSIIKIDVLPVNPNNIKPNPHYAIPAGPIQYSGTADPGVNELPNIPFANAATQNPNFLIPRDNPFVHTSKGGSWNGQFNGTDHGPSGLNDLAKVRDEMWAIGLRNPFKFCLDTDPLTGEVEAWYGDVGKDDREEFTKIKKGENGGWAYYEGDIRAPGITYQAQPTTHREPLFSYSHSVGKSATGGVIYHGSKLASLNNRYVCADFSTGRFWSISRDGTSIIELPGLQQSSQRVVDLLEDPATGDIFVLENNTWSGAAGAPKLLRITLQEGETDDFPQTLDELGLFADPKTRTPNPGVVPYGVNLRFWSDGADKTRFFTIPNSADRIGFREEGPWTFPVGMVWVKHFDYDLNQTQPGTSLRPLETRVLVRTATGAYGVSYRWDANGQTATLVPAQGADFPVTFRDPAGQQTTITWHIPSRSECMTCHLPTGGFALSMNTRQLNLSGLLSGQSGNQISLLTAAGYLDGFSGDPATRPRHYRPQESGINLEARVRSYLDVNCGYCHQPNGGAVPSWDGRAFQSIDGTGLLYGQPQSEGVAHPDHKLVVPGNRDGSIVWNRINARSAIGSGTFNGESQMPPLATNVVDAEGVALIREWIDNFANTAPSITNSGSPASASAASPPGTTVSSVVATDPDVRLGVSDQSHLSYQVTGGNSARFFALNPQTGRITVNGLLDQGSPSYNLQLTITDNFAPNPRSTVTNVAISVDQAVVDGNQNGLPDWWETQFGLSNPPGQGDSDGDGVSNFFEFLGGSDPSGGGSQFSPVADGLVVNPGNGERGFEFSWRERIGLNLHEDYRVEFSSDLRDWHELLPADYALVGDLPDGDGFHLLTIRVPSAAPRGFLRLVSGAGSVSLFNGQNLNGWFAAEGNLSYYSVVPANNGDPAFIRGTATGARGMLATTANSYANFELSFEVRAQDPFNSGLQFRSFVNSSNLVQGYQAEVDPTSRAWTGGLYEQSGRAWLQDLSANQPARQAYRPGQWNHIRVLAEGTRIRHWINGVPAVDFTETSSSARTSGLLALQVHPGGSEIQGKTVDFRRLYLRELP